MEKETKQETKDSEIVELTENELENVVGGAFDNNKAQGNGGAVDSSAFR